jgi:uncharacterized protein (DUF849 family)
MNDSGNQRLVDELCRSYTLQAELYSKLNAVVQKIYSQLVLSRGNLSGVMSLFEEKQRLLNAINAQREETKNDAEIWQKTKDTIEQTKQTAILDEVLTHTQNNIQKFLETEQQLEHYLKHMMNADTKSET